MSTPVLTRRAWLGRASRGLVVLGVASAAVGCGGQEAPALDCSNPPGLDPQQRSTRTALAYVDRGPDPMKVCERCNFYTVAQPGQCGGCTLNIGAVNPKGSCNSFTPKA